VSLWTEINDPEDEECPAKGSIMDACGGYEAEFKYWNPMIWPGLGIEIKLRSPSQNI
jgi:hypothetical protein